MITIKELINKYKPGNRDNQDYLYPESAVREMLKEYGTMVVDECSRNTKVGYHATEFPGNWKNSTHDKKILKDSILRVKDSIK